MQEAQLASVPTQASTNAVVDEALASENGVSSLSFDNVFVDEDEEAMYEEEPIWQQVAPGLVTDKEWNGYENHHQPKKLSPHLKELLGLIQTMERSKCTKAAKANE